jgi:hypothetical protein
LKAQLVLLTEAKAAASTLKKIGEKLGEYLDVFLTELSKSAAKGSPIASAPLWYWFFFNDFLSGVVHHRVAASHHPLRFVGPRLLGAWPSVNSP